MHRAFCTAFGAAPGSQCGPIEIQCTRGVVLLLPALRCVAGSGHPHSVLPNHAAAPCGTLRPQLTSQSPVVRSLCHPPATDQRGQPPVLWQCVGDLGSRRRCLLQPPFGFRKHATSWHWRGCPRSGAFRRVRPPGRHSCPAQRSKAGPAGTRGTGGLWRRRRGPHCSRGSGV
jgi:hypothetical protein